MVLSPDQARFDCLDPLSRLKKIVLSSDQILLKRDHLLSSCQPGLDDINLLFVIQKTLKLE